MSYKLSFFWKHEKTCLSIRIMISLVQILNLVGLGQRLIVTFKKLKRPESVKIVRFCILLFRLTSVSISTGIFNARPVKLYLESIWFDSVSESLTLNIQHTRTVEFTIPIRLTSGPPISWSWWIYQKIWIFSYSTNQFQEKHFLKTWKMVMDGSLNS